MKIRDIQNFRFFYKTGVRKTWDKNRDENFIGSSESSNGKTQFGFFDIYHGDKANEEGIEGFLRGFLDMAQDSQAIYEFLQNAVDANSTTFEMYYDEDYFLAFNNGSQFNFEGIRSILNVGVSTKSQDSSNIGKFGIGFKLIHRLVGESSGLEELKKLSGPILFSWGSATQLQNLQNFSQNENIEFEKDYYKELDNGKFGNTKSLSWLFKILLTNFPCQPGETIKDLNYREVSNAFTKAEVAELAHWTKNKIKVDTSKHSLNSGSLFFLQLGKNKGNMLSNKRIEDGIQFSLSILNSIAKFQEKQGISQIRVNENVFESKKLFFERFVIKFGSEEYNQIKPQRRNEEDTSDIEVLVGFMDYKTALTEIKGNPNFYLFFPLSDEVHNLSFIIHSTGFYNASQRTNLQGNESNNTETQGINEALLKVITEKIKQKLLTYRNNTAKDDKFRYRFLNIYSNLLLSNKATENHKNWVDTCLLEPIFNILKLQVPTQNGYSDNPKNVKIKDIRLNINPSDFGCPEIEWFAWQEKYDKILIDEARNSEKLNLEKWDIVDLLEYAISKGKITKINDWVKKIEVETTQIFTEEKKLRESNPSKELPKKYKPYISLLHELNDRVSKSNTDIISKIKLFKFSDDNYYSLDDVFCIQNIILKNVSISSIWAILNYKLDFIISKQDISNYKNLYNLYQQKVTNLSLFQKITSKTKDAAQSETKEKRLYPDDKKKIFLVLLELSKDSEGKIDTKRIRDIEMFSDTQKRIMPLRKLIKGDSQVSNWLFAFMMNQYEDMPHILEYCTKEDEIYKNVILENWDSIVAYENLNANYFYPELLKYYDVSKDKEFLETKELSFVATQNGFKKISEIFFNPVLEGLKNSKYRSLQDLISKVFQKELPRFDVFPHFIKKDSPLRITENQSITSFLVVSENLEYHEINALLSFAKLNKENIFESIYIESKNNRFRIVKHSNSIFQYYSNRQEINELLANQSNFKLLPKEFNANDFRELGIWQDKGLYIKVLQTLDFSKSLLPIVQESDNDVKLAYLEKLETFSLQVGKDYDRNSFEHRCLKLAIECYADDFQVKFAPKVLVNGELRIKDIAVQDDVNFEGLTLSLASILPDCKGISDIITKIINQFKDFTKTELSDRVFPIRNKNKDEIFEELQKQLPSICENIEQFKFLLYFTKLKKHIFSFNFTDIKWLSEILQFAYKQKFTELSTFVNFGLQDKIYPSELALETEKLPTWVLTWLESTDKQEKLIFLNNLGVHTENSNLFAIRKFFETGQIVDFQGKVFTIPQNSILLVNTLKWLQNNTFKASDNVKLDALKHIFSRINYTNEIPLLYISQMIESEIFYELEVSTITKYFFETPQKEYSQKVFKVLQKEGFKLIALDFFNHWKESIVDLTKVQVNSLLDLNSIKDNSEEWKDSAYEQWKVNQNYKILIYKGEKMPYKTLFLKQEIDAFVEGTSIEKDGVIYVCQSVKDGIRNNLSKHINADELIKLYQLDNNSVDIVQSLQSRISQLEEELALLRSPKNAQNDTLISDLNEVITSKEYNLETGYKAEAYVYEQLINQGFRNVVWTNQASIETNQRIVHSGNTYFINEKGEPYDLIFMDEKDNTCYVQVKGTTTTFDRADDVKMIITRQEWLFLQKDEYKDIYFMARVFGARDSPTMKFFKMEFKIGT